MNLYLVVFDTGSIHSCHFDRERADDMAEKVGGVVATMLIVSDYRTE